MLSSEHDVVVSLKDPLRRQLLDDLQALRQAAGMNVDVLARAEQLLSLPSLRVLADLEERPSLVYDLICLWLAQEQHDDRRAALANAFALEGSRKATLQQRRNEFADVRGLTLQNVRDREDAALDRLIDDLLDDCVRLADRLMANGSNDLAGAWYQDVEVVATLAPGSTEEFVALSIDFFARVPDRRWIVGITRDEVLAEQLCAFSEEINDVICPGPLGITTSESLQLTVYPESDIRARATIADFSPATPEDVAKLTGVEDLIGLADVEWIVADLSERDSDTVRVNFCCAQELHRSSRYCFWTAPRACHLSRISFDVSRFPGRDQHHFSLRPFLGVLVTADERHDQLELRVDADIERGHGVALIWGDARQ
jgi:hypothetical protein